MYTRAVVTRYLVYVLFRGAHVVEWVARKNFYSWFIHDWKLLLRNVCNIIIFILYANIEEK